jgi:hypothetical protein
MLVTIRFYINFTLSYYDGILLEDDCQLSRAIRSTMLAQNHRMSVTNKQVIPLYVYAACCNRVNG